MRIPKEFRLNPPATPEEIAKAEKALGVIFPPDYRKFLAKAGWLRVGAHEIGGLGNQIPSYLDVVNTTKRERAAGRLPRSISRI